MIHKDFTELASNIKAWSKGQTRDTRAHLLVMALKEARGHDVADVHAFAHGCDDNPYADALRPMLFAGACLSDRDHLRRAMHDVFNHCLQTAWTNWLARENAPETVETGKIAYTAPVRQADIAFDPRAGLNRFLDCAGRTKECRQLHS